MPSYIIHITLEEIVDDKHAVTARRGSPYRTKLIAEGQHAEQIADEVYGFSARKQHLALHIFDKIDDRILATIPLRWRRQR